MDERGLDVDGVDDDDPEEPPDPDEPDGLPAAPDESLPVPDPDPVPEDEDSDPPVPLVPAFPPGTELPGPEPRESVR